MPPAPLRTRSRRPPDGEERTRILVVDDDPHALRYVRDTLAEADYAPVVTGDPEELPELVRKHKPRLVLLDLVLPGTDGIKLMEGLRELEDLPVIFISAYDRDETIRQGAGCGSRRLHLEAVLAVGADGAGAGGPAAARRAGALHAGGPGDPLRGPPRHRRRASLTLTMTEFEVLRVLSANAGRAVTYDSLLRQAWGKRERGSAAPKLVRALVKGLRSKLGDDAARPAYLCNVRGVGYRMPRPGER